MLDHRSFRSAMCAGLIALAPLGVAAAQTQPAASQPDGAAASRLEAATVLYRYVVEQGMMEQIMDAMQPMFSKQMDLLAAQRGVTFTEEVKAAIFTIVSEETTATFDEVKPDIINAYAAHLTLPELQKSIELYESPEGRSMMAKMQGLTATISAIITPKMQEMQGRIVPRIARDVAPLMEKAQ